MATMNQDSVNDCVKTMNIYCANQKPTWNEDVEESTKTWNELSAKEQEAIFANNDSAEAAKSDAEDYPYYLNAETCDLVADVYEENREQTEDEEYATRGCNLYHERREAAYEAY